MEELEVKNYLAAWSDILSLLLLGLAIFVAGIDPRRRVWGHSLLRRVLIIFTVSLNVIFSAGRLIAESVLVETGPREFLLLSVIYCARWIWLYFGISHSRSGKAFAVALELRWLKTIRLDKSTRHPDSDSGTQVKSFTDGLRAILSRMMTWGKARKKKVQSSTELSESHDNRLDEAELVIRRGKRTVRGTVYWRGVEELVKPYEVKGNQIYFVRLVQRELHSDHLDKIGTCEFKKSLDVEGADRLYKNFYELVMTCDMQSSELQVDYSPFLTKYKGVRASTAPAIRVGATSNTVLGDVARRVAADACYYVFHDGADLRTGDHVQCINDCIQNAAKTCLDIDANDLDSPV